MLPENAKKKAEKTVSNFVDAINKNQDISKYFTSKEANYGGQIWMPLNEYAKFIKSILPKQIDSLKLIYYNFDDVESDELIKAKALELNRVFNNFSIIASGKFNSQNITLVLQPVNSDIKIYSITVESVALKMASKEIDAFYDTIPNIQLALSIPKGFEGPINEKEMISYTLKGNTERDAIIQIMYLNQKAPINVITEKWAQHITSGYKRSEFEISYLLNGYIFNYEIIDAENNVNKGITIGIEHNGYSIIIQYFGFKNAYDKHWNEVDQMIRIINLY